MSVLIILSLLVCPVFGQDAAQPGGGEVPPTQVDSSLAVHLAYAGTLVQITVEHPTAEVVFLELYDTDGYRVYEQMLELIEGRQWMELKLNTLKDGKLLVRCYAEPLENQQLRYKPTDIQLVKDRSEVNLR
ncbi:MAG: hypothetical protein LW884_03625 [Bacteroidetes bacterium]|jgi:hypothetical protein|nr:hypothetical protein [Bacteroidota bacterium]